MTDIAITVVPPSSSSPELGPSRTFSRTVNTEQMEPGGTISAIPITSGAGSTWSPGLAVPASIQAWPPGAGRSLLPDVGANANIITGESNIRRIYIGRPNAASPLSYASLPWSTLEQA